MFFCVSFDRSEVPKHTECGCLLLKFNFRVEFFDFRIQHCELTLDLGISPSPGSKAKYFSIVFTKEINESP
jgi:hypothetical protein